MGKAAPRLRTVRPALPVLDPRSGLAIAPEAAEHERKRRFDRQRGSARQRGYDADWRRLRDAVVIERGCRCEHCGRLVALRKRDANDVTPVAHVDHIQSIAERPDLRLDRSNLRLLCEPCHNGRTARDQGFARQSGAAE